MGNLSDITKHWREQYHAAQIQAGMKLCPVVDWMNGGYLEGYMDTCEKCDGDGYVEDEDAEI